MRCRLILFFLITITTCGQAQNREADSLLKAIGQNKQDTLYADALNRLSKLLQVNEPERSLQFALNARMLSDKLHYTKGKAKALVYQADYFYFKGIADSAEIKYLEAIRLFESINDKNGAAWGYMTAGNNFTYIGDYEKAITYVLKSVKLNEEAGNKSGYAWALETAGSIFGQLNALPKAKDYTLKALGLMKELNNEDGIASCFNTLGIVNDIEGNAESALEYYQRALVLRQKNNNLVEMANLKANIGVVYLALGQYRKAISCFKESSQLALQCGQTASLASDLINTGDAYLRLKNYPLSITSLLQGIALSDSLGIIEYKQEGCQLLAEAYFGNGDFKNAYRYRQLYSDCKDSILKTSSARSIFEMNSKYEAEKKDKELLLKDAEISKQQLAARQQSLQRNSFIIAFALMLGLSFFILRGYRQTRRINEEVSKQKELLEEKQKEILDSIHYARRIQKALITPEKYIERVLKKRLHA